MSNVLIRNARLNLAYANHVVYAPDLTANLQRDRRDHETISALLAGRGRSENDRPYLYRARIDLLPDGQVPQVNDKIFVAYHATNRNLTGWYTLWTDVDQTSGLLASLILYIRKDQ